MKTLELSIDLKRCYIRVVRVMWRAKRFSKSLTFTSGGLFFQMVSFIPLLIRRQNIRIFKNDIVH